MGSREELWSTHPGPRMSDSMYRVRRTGGSGTWGAVQGAASRRLTADTAKVTTVSLNLESCGDAAGLGDGIWLLQSGSPVPTAHEMKHQRQHQPSLSFNSAPPAPSPSINSYSTPCTCQLSCTNRPLPTVHDA